MSEATIINTSKGVLKIYSTGWLYRTSSLEDLSGPDKASWSGSLRAIGYARGSTWLKGDLDAGEAKVIYEALWERGRYRECLSLSRWVVQDFDLQMEDLKPKLDEVFERTRVAEGALAEAEAELEPSVLDGLTEAHSDKVSECAELSVAFVDTVSDLERAEARATRSARYLTFMAGVSFCLLAYILLTSI